MKKKNVMVSIIVPIFHAKHLVNCVDSILNQSYEHLQIILVDGSLTAETEMICQTFKHKDSRIMHLHARTTDINLAQALNHGLTYAHGDFVQFVHEDDYIDVQMTEKLIMNADDNISLVLCGYHEIHYKNNCFYTKETIPAIRGTYLKDEFMQHIGSMVEQSFISSPYNKLYRKNTIQAHQLIFHSKLDCGNTALFNLAYIDKISCMHILAEPLYHSTAAVHDIRSSYQSFQSRQKLYQQVEDFMRANKSFDGKNKSLLEKVRVNSTLNAIDALFDSGNGLTSKQKKEALSQMMQNEGITQTLQYPNQSMQEKTVVSLFKTHNVEGLYAYIKTRQMLKKQISPLYHLLKKTRFRKKSS